MTETTDTYGQEGGWLAKTSYALFDVGNSAVGAMHATFIFAVYFASAVAPENGEERRRIEIKIIIRCFNLVY